MEPEPSGVGAAWSRSHLESEPTQSRRSQNPAGTGPGTWQVYDDECDHGHVQRYAGKCAQEPHPALLSEKYKNKPSVHNRTETALATTLPSLSEHLSCLSRLCLSVNIQMLDVMIF